MTKDELLEILLARSPSVPDRATLLRLRPTVGDLFIVLDLCGVLKTNTGETLNRYGGAGFVFEGELCCRHSVPLRTICERCNELLSWITKADGLPEYPTLAGVGDTVKLDDPLEELAALGEQPAPTRGPESGGSIKA